MTKSVHLLAAIAAACWLAAPARAQSAAAPAGAQPKTSGAPEACRAMMQQHQAAAAEQRASLAKLDKLVSSMKTASGRAKTDLMAQAIAEIANEQRAEMNLHEHLMQNMASCPMAQGGMMQGGKMQGGMKGMMRGTTPKSGAGAATGQGGRTE